MASSRAVPSSAAGTVTWNLLRQAISTASTAPARTSSMSQRPRYWSLAPEA